MDRKLLLFISIIFLTENLIGQHKSENVKIPDGFPSDYVITEFNPSCKKGDHYFYPDGSYVFDYDDICFSDMISFGSWKLKGSKVIINETKLFGNRGIGLGKATPETEGAAAPEYIHPKYARFENWIDETKEIELKYFFIHDYWIDTSQKASDYIYKNENFEIDGDYKVASCRKLDEYDLENLSKDELRIMRNEIFARYGYKFKSEDLKKYFSSKSWYRPLRDDTNEFITELEKENIELIQIFEKK